MAAVITNLVKRGALGGLPNPGQVEFDIALDASYPAGGYPIAPATGGFANDLDFVSPGMALNGINLLIPVWDEATNTLRLFYPTGGTAASPSAPAQPVATVTPDAGAVTMTGSAAKPTLTAVTTPGAGKEVPTGAVLTGYSVHCRAWGT